MWACEQISARESEDNRATLAGAAAAAPKIKAMKKCLFYRHFRIVWIFVQKILLAKFFSSRRRSADRRVRSARVRDAAVTHKIMRSHCYFFSAVVIGC
jgi:hypothetical protein